jgi:hypothetical protein
MIHHQDQTGNLTADSMPFIAINGTMSEQFLSALNITEYNIKVSIFFLYLEPINSNSLNAHDVEMVSVSDEKGNYFDFYF